MEPLNGVSKLRLPEYRGRRNAGKDNLGRRNSRSTWPTHHSASRELTHSTATDTTNCNSCPVSSCVSPSSRQSAGAACPSPSSRPETIPESNRDCTFGGPSGTLGCAGNVRVAVRVRPLPPGEEGIIEVAGSGAIAIRKEPATGGNEFLSSQQGRIEERMFDQVFGPDASQPEVFGWGCAPLVSEAVATGRSATVFVYGATGAGKTYTMFGTGGCDHEGLIFRAIPEVFSSVNVHNSKLKDEGNGLLEVKVSFLEIYNEVVRDLLQDGCNGTCRVLEDERRGVVKVANLLEAQVKSPDEALWYLHAGMQARTIEATAANSQSSRAHAVFTLTIENVRVQQGRGPFSRRGVEARQLHSKITLIDLAGSERAALTQNSGAALKDGARINQSLLALANCIDALTARSRDGQSTPRKKPPYRDSKLTLMLKGSLTGDGLVSMIANVHPGRSHFEDSNNTLEYAKRASSIRTAASRRLSRTFSMGTSVVDDSGPQFNLEQAILDASSIADVVQDPGDDEHTPGTSSFSSSVRSCRLIGASRRRSCCASNQAKNLTVCDSAERTTASSPEECLSEISLSSHGGVEHEKSHDMHEQSTGFTLLDGYAGHYQQVQGPGHLGHAIVLKEPEMNEDADWKASDLLTPASSSSGAEGGGSSACCSRSTSGATSRNGSVADRKVDQDSGNCDLDETSPRNALQMSAAPSVTLHQARQSLADTQNLSVALELVSVLQKEHSHLDAHVQALTLQNHAILDDKRALEQEVVRLRAANLHMSKQMALLMQQLNA